MRRKTMYMQKSKQKAITYTAALIMLTVYGIPRMPKMRPGISGSFVTLWILFVSLAIAANLYFLIGADKERSKMLEITESKAAVPEAERQHRRAY